MFKDIPCSIANVWIDLQVISWLQLIEEEEGEKTGNKTSPLTTDLNHLVHELDSHYVTPCKYGHEGMRRRCL